MSEPSVDTSPAETPVADLSYEQARDELVALVARIESGQVPLEEAMALWERGEELAAHCQTKLDAAQETLDRATDRDEGVAPSQDRSTQDEPSEGTEDASD
ncbi:exodeoxyribonuclease VII small subunit [Serinicoccus marinus]|uniref:exodeoxyribonuclease VII small subunit n=1 Tax=Serinicoccus marinus TaxID=247333 RepID=UPI0024937C44|nr:exodeoxyribonuclease VII small subunit [Serinicoccus marinus]